MCTFAAVLLVYDKAVLFSYFRIGFITMLFL